MRAHAWVGLVHGAKGLASSSTVRLARIGSARMGRDGLVV